MKELLVLSIVLGILLSLTALPLAVQAGVGNPDQECRNHGFDFGVVKWEPLDTAPGWAPEGGDPKGTSVNGTTSAATWDVGTSNATGIVVKAGQDYFIYYGTGSTIYQGQHAFSHITFCGDENVIPEFTVIGTALAAVLAGAFLFILKRRN